MGIKSLWKKIRHLTDKVSHLKKKIHRLQRQISESVSNVAYDEIKSELSSAVNNVTILTSEITQLGKELNAAQLNLRKDAQKMGEIATLAERVAPLISEVDAINQSLQHDLKLIDNLPVDMKSTRHEIVSTAADLAPRIAVRAEQMATRLNALEVLAEPEMKDIAKELESLRELSTDVVKKVGTLFDESLPETTLNMLSSLSKTVKGDGEAFQQSFVHEIENIAKALQELCTAHHLPYPAEIQSHVALIKKYSTQAPREIFDVLAALVPIDQLRNLKKSIEKGRPQALSPKQNDTINKQVDSADHLIRTQSKKKEDDKDDKKMLSRAGATAMVSSIAILRNLRLIIASVSNAFPVSVAATYSWGASAHEGVDLGGDAGATAEGSACVLEGVSAALSSTFLSLMPLLLNPISGFFALVIYVLEFTLGLIVIHEEVVDA